MSSKQYNEIHTIQITVNSQSYSLQVQPNWTLAHVLREQLGLTGTKIACDEGACGACTVLIEGETVLSCMTLAVECNNIRIQTIEGLSQGDRLHPIQDAWLEEHGAQCGFCSPGMIMTAKAFLEENPDPTERDVRRAMSGNICRCANYDHIVKSVMAGAKKLKERKHGA
jgi:aerobic carbon-monoxide dehydrogenase small subunit